MTSAQRKRGLRNAANLRTNSSDFADREGGGVKNPEILWTSFMKAPFPLARSLDSVKVPLGW